MSSIGRPQVAARPYLVRTAPTWALAVWPQDDGTAYVGRVWLPLDALRLAAARVWGRLRGA